MHRNGARPLRVGQTASPAVIARPFASKPSSRACTRPPPVALLARGEGGWLLRLAVARPCRSARRGSPRRCARHLPGENRTPRKPDQQQSLQEGLRADTKSAYPDASPGPTGRVRRVHGTATPGVQTQTELHEAARRNGIVTGPSESCRSFLHRSTITDTNNP